jgi:hypothetical protein
MYQFTGKLKILAVALMVIGLLGTAWSFMTTPSSLKEAKEIIAKQAAHHGGHSEADTHGEAKPHHEEKVKSTQSHDDTAHKEEVTSQSHDEAKHAEEVIDTTHASTSINKDVTKETHKAEETSHHKVVSEDSHADSHNDDHHAEHVFHQMQNRPWSAFYVAMLFFLGVTLLVFAFYVSQRVANAGWSIVLFRVMEAITNNLHYVSGFMLMFIILTVMHKNHLFPWMAEGIFDPLSDNYDPIIDGKKWFMNLPGWAIRSVIYLLGWNIFRFIIRKKSIQQDNGDLKLHKNLYNIGVGFIVFFMISESMMSWDWIMGIDPHWFSTLFGWYVLATFLVSALTVIAIVTIYLRSKGALPFVNDSHIHDLVKFMFGFSVFWTYLWFAQFMLIWYADMPEETTYFAQRFNEYKLPFLLMVVLNFIFPVLLLINSDFKSIPWLVIIGGVVILIGHYIDLFVMIMPGTVGGQWGFGIGEISGILFFIGLFIFATFSAFAKVNPLAKGSPFLHESETHHYYNIEHRGEDSNHH